MKLSIARIAVAALILTPAFQGARAAQPELLGSVWRQGTTDKTVWLVGTLRAATELDHLAAQEAHPAEGDSVPQKPLRDTFMRVEAQCADDDFTIRVKANAFEQEPPQISTETPYAFENSPLREASVTVNGNSALNLHYLWGAISGASLRADDRLNLAGAMYRFLDQIEQLPKSEIRIFTPKGSAAYLLDTAYQADTNKEAMTQFKRLCAEAAGNWH